MEKQIYYIISTLLNVPLSTVTIESTPDTLENWDSVMHLNISAALEEEFNIQFTDDQIVEMVTVRKIINTVNQLVK